jgi:Cu/Ag efflux protein CusF
MKQFVLRTALALAFASLLQPVVAMDHSSHAAPVAKAANQVLSEGKVRRLDRGAGSVTITHGPIENLGMGAMTMTFSFKQGVVPASVQGWRPGSLPRRGKGQPVHRRPRRAGEVVPCVAAPS